MSTGEIQYVRKFLYVYLHLYLFTRSIGNYVLQLVSTSQHVEMS